MSHSCPNLVSTSFLYNPYIPFFNLQNFFIYYIYGMAGQGKLKHHDGSGVNAMAEQTSVNASLPSLQDKPYPSLGLCVTQAILEENPVFHIRDRNNQRLVLLQRSACKLKVCTPRARGEPFP